MPLTLQLLKRSIYNRHFTSNVYGLLILHSYLKRLTHIEKNALMKWQESAFLLKWKECRRHADGTQTARRRHAVPTPTARRQAVLFQIIMNYFDYLFNFFRQNLLLFNQKLFLCNIYWNFLHAAYNELHPRA